MKTKETKPSVQDIFPDIKPQHTQGEWEPNYQERKVESKKGTIAQCYSQGSTSITDEEANANIDFISASPDMYAALKHEIYILKEARVFAELHTKIFYDGIISRMEKAIAKAEGK